MSSEPETDDAVEELASVGKALSRAEPIEKRYPDAPAEALELLERLEALEDRLDTAEKRRQQRKRAKEKAIQQLIERVEDIDAEIRDLEKSHGVK